MGTPSSSGHTAARDAVAVTLGFRRSQMQTLAPPGVRLSAVMAAVGALATGVTLTRYGIGEVGASWVAAQLFLVVVAAIDAATHRIPNHIVGPAAALLLLLRAAYAEHSFLQAVAAAAVVLAGFATFAVATRGFGMGDVKLSALLGLLLGWQVLPALLIGAVAGGVGAGFALATGRASRHTAIAYGPYLCLGATLTIFFFHPSAFV